MEQVLSVLYGISGIAATALYLPQILRYHREPATRQSISLLTWSGWIIVTLVTVLYAACVVKSSLFALVAGINALAQATVWAYGMHARMTGTSQAPAGSPSHTISEKYVLGDKTTA